MEFCGCWYEFLASHDVTETEWTELHPTAPFYLFVPQDTNLRTEYERALSIAEVFNPYGSKTGQGIGIVTHNDELFIGFD